MQWLQIDLELISSFSLRPSNATSPSGKSLLIPTPYSIKMALLDCAIRHDGLAVAIEIFPLIRDLQVFIQLPQIAVVSTISRRIQRPEGKKFQDINIAQELWVYGGAWAIALGTEAEDFVPKLGQISLGLSYLGQRGGFVQILGQTICQDLALDFTNLMTALDPSMPSIGFTQRMDDMLEDSDFEDVSRFSHKSHKKANTRRQYDVVLPYRLIGRGNSHLVYEYNSIHDQQTEKDF